MLVDELHRGNPQSLDLPPAGAQGLFRHCREVFLVVLGVNICTFSNLSFLMMLCGPFRHFLREIRHRPRNRIAPSLSLLMSTICTEGRFAIHDVNKSTVLALCCLPMWIRSFQC
jgi:hypothetical protein